MLVVWPMRDQELEPHKQSCTAAPMRCHMGGKMEPCSPGEAGIGTVWKSGGHTVWKCGRGNKGK
jgi:hypothetical protein